MTTKERMTKIIGHLNGGIHEREETIAVAFLAALSDQNVFLFGPPGTAKSLIARRLSYAFETNGYFEYLMHRFSTPEDVFGPVSITELKKDNFLRKTEGFLPQSDFAFLDEIWKSSPAILNTLLTIINEKLFRNGTEVEPAPLKALIAASNETPPPGQGLDALYDRFLVRLNVPPMAAKENFERLLNAQPTRAELKLPDGLAIQHAEWEKWCEEIHAVKLSDKTQNIIHDIRLSFEEKGEELDVYVSDRRWQKSAILLKAAAFFCGRTETNLVDTLLLRHCLWTTKENCEEVRKIVENAVRNCGFETGINIRRIDDQKDELDKEINEELFHSEDVYETENLRGDEYFKCTTRLIQRHHYFPQQRESVSFYIPLEKMKSTDEFHPVDRQGNELAWIKCCFDGQGTCSISMHQQGENADLSYHQDHHWQNASPFTPKVLFHKGDKKKKVNPRLIDSLRKAVQELAQEIEGIIGQIESKRSQFKRELETPFVPEDIRGIALESVEKQLRDMKVRRQDCDRLEKLIPSNDKGIVAEVHGESKSKDSFEQLDLKVINLASEIELQKLGLKSDVAKNLVDYREENGDFQQLNKLREVHGIGHPTLEQLKKNLKDLYDVAKDRRNSR